ncbi:transcriptional regulator PpsR [Pseudorhodoplanes sp.]|uniref:transcriptional regulator PpsR n=1 Tax=Pseudorhodoplanes sp. TaxID=1934341 RepID=UPI00391BCECE
MSNINIAQPDVTLLLDLDGVIREATLSRSLSGEGVHDWLGKRWTETVVDVGGEKVQRMLSDAREQGVSAFRQVTQRFPSGLELPMEYTTVLLGGRAGLLAVGKNLQAVAELQSRLIAAQQAMERDYWKLREVETRYRLLFDTSNEPVMLLRTADLRILQANPAALAALDLKSAPDAGDRDFVQTIAPEDRDAFQSMTLRAREHGKAPGILVHLGSERKPWLVRASLMSPEPNSVTMLQLSPGWHGQTAIVSPDSISIDDLIERLPDGFVVLDCDGVIRRANRAFLDLVEAGAKGSVVGERLARWLSRPGADLAVLLANVERHKFVRMFTTTIQGELGTTTEVEISAAGNDDTAPQYIGALIRDVGRRIGAPGDDKNLRSSLGAMAERIGKTPLRTLVKDTVAIVERHYVKSALDLANDNRTVAAELLGLSRQSLYAKLNRYGLDRGSETPEGAE